MSPQTPQHNHLLCGSCLGKSMRRSKVATARAPYLCELRILPDVSYRPCCGCGCDPDALRPPADPRLETIAFRHRSDVDWEGFGEQPPDEQKKHRHDG